MARALLPEGSVGRRLAGWPSTRSRRHAADLFHGRLVASVMANIKARLRPLQLVHPLHLPEEVRRQAHLCAG